MKQTSSLIKSRANKAKNHKWSSVDRFRTGHDAASIALLPEHEQLRLKSSRATPVGVWRSASFDQPQAERIFETAQRLINAGRVSNVDEAVDRATKAVSASWGTQLGNEVIVEIK